MDITSSSALNIGSTQPSYKKNAESLPHMQYVDKQLSDIKTHVKEDKVSISSQALALFQQEKSQNTNTQSVESSVNDQAIENIKKQLEKLKQELNNIQHDNSEDAKRERRMLQGQINALNASMLDLLGKKLNGI
ncbi:hypothetical protein [Thalassotalea atypica]|uniref:hypothetical protein n=1 Tax=Thalassotalea atypica TaxID=2054316 RepID=UPI002572A59A|nr:hypothetical protein [Thalassotalea atypica]